MAVNGTRLEFPRRSHARAVTNSIVGAALGSIMAIIMTTHMPKISAAYGPLHAGGIAIICLPPTSIIFIPTPAPSHR